MRRGFGRTGAAVVVALLLAGGITGCGDKNRAPRDVAAPVGLPTALADTPADQPTEAPPAVEAMGAAPSTKASPSAKAT